MATSTNTKRLRWAAGAVAVGAGIAGLAALSAPAGSDPATEALDVSDLFVEINASDGDAGLHLDLDGVDWRDLRIVGPDGRKLVDVRGGGSLGTHGLTGLTFESAEPPFGELSLDEFRARFPEGRYTFRATAVDGTRLVGEDELTHDFPDGPVVTSPQPGEVVDPADLVVTWEPVTGVDIVRYQVIVVQEEPDGDRELVADLPPTATSMAVPAEFLDPTLDTKLEVLAREASGNQTITEVAFELG